MHKIIRIGSRESRLAVAQAELIKEEIVRCNPQIKVEIVTMKTTGDKILDRSLESIGGKGLFVKELDQALLDGRIDLAVHSLKDMPMEQLPQLPILAYSRREDARDVLICKPGLSSFSGGTKDVLIRRASGDSLGHNAGDMSIGGTKDMPLPDKAVIGTSSRRRKIQLQKLCPTVQFRGIRGNVQTRLKKLAEEGYDATILAAAGLKRLGMESVITRYFDTEEMIPAAGQGILAVQGRKGEYTDWISCINDQQSEWAALAERQFVRALGGGCTSPVAAHAKVAGRELCLRGLYYEEGSGAFFTDTISGDAEQAQQLGERLAMRMRSS